jgi:hypothetical protein
LDGHQICEVIKRNDALCEIPVVVIQGAGASPPDASAEGFGADLYLEPADGDAALESIREPLVAWGLRVPRRAPEPRESAPAPVPQPIPAGPEASVPAAASAPAADAGGIGEAGEFADELARAERLARIAVSDIVLYNEEKFAAALQSEDPLQTMRDELEEGRALLRGRIAQEVFAQRDFVGDELARVARERA